MPFPANITDLRIGETGDISLAPASTPHKFVNSGAGRLSTINIHPSARIIQEAVE